VYAGPAIYGLTGCVEARYYFAVEVEWNMIALTKRTHEALSEESGVKERENELKVTNVL
jgi:hypothetical protein